MFLWGMKYNISAWKFDRFSILSCTLHCSWSPAEKNRLYPAERFTQVSTVSSILPKLITFSYPWLNKDGLNIVQKYCHKQGVKFLFFSHFFSAYSYFSYFFSNFTLNLYFIYFFSGVSFQLFIFRKWGTPIILKNFPASLPLALFHTHIICRII